MLNHCSHSWYLFSRTSIPKVCAIQALKFCRISYLDLARVRPACHFLIELHQIPGFVNHTILNQKNTTKSVPTKALVCSYEKTKLNEGFSGPLRSIYSEEPHIHSKETSQKSPTSTQKRPISIQNSPTSTQKRPVSTQKRSTSTFKTTWNLFEPAHYLLKRDPHPPRRDSIHVWISQRAPYPLKRDPNWLKGDPNTLKRAPRPPKRALYSHEETIIHSKKTTSTEMNHRHRQGWRRRRVAPRAGLLMLLSERISFCPVPIHTQTHLCIHI